MYMYMYDRPLNTGKPVKEIMPEEDKVSLSLRLLLLELYLGVRLCEDFPTHVGMSNGIIVPMLFRQSHYLYFRHVISLRYLKDKFIAEFLIL